MDQSRGATRPDSLWIFTMVAFKSTIRRWFGRRFGMMDVMLRMSLKVPRDVKNIVTKSYFPALFLHFNHETFQAPQCSTEKLLKHLLTMQSRCCDNQHIHRILRQSRTHRMYSAAAYTNSIRCHQQSRFFSSVINTWANFKPKPHQRGRISVFGL